MPHRNVTEADPASRRLLAGDIGRRTTADGAEGLGPSPIVAIEVKAGATVRTEDIRHLAHLRDALGDRFHRGILLHTGDATRSLGDRLVATPIASLWA